jgi:signal transduction histidine kinase
MTSLYLLNVAFIVLLAVTLFVVIRLVLRPPPHRDALVLRSWIVTRLAEGATRGDRAGIEPDLRWLRANHLRVAVYGVDGALLAATEDPPERALSTSQRDHLPAAGKWTSLSRDVVAGAIAGADGRALGTAVVGLPPRVTSYTWLAWTVGLMLVFLGVASILFARSLARPLAHLARVARAFGDGDLAARARLDRHDELGDVGRAFDDMAARVERLLSAQRELLANVSHELRTPLSRIRVALDLAAEGDSALAKESLGEIGVDLADLERLVEAVLTAARLELHSESRPALRLAPVDVAALVQSAAARFRTVHADHPLSVEVTPPIAAIDADESLVRRVLDNLLDNACKYSEPDEPIVVRASDDHDGKAVRVEIVDRGIGIAAEDLPKLFTPFFRTDRSRARTTGGVGLGLVIARRIAEAHGGTLTIESSGEKGATAVLSLPAT